MAKTKWQPKRVRHEDERRGSSDFIVLDEGEKFLGYALFEADPKKDDPGYYEFLQHWDTASKRSIPCAGDDCPICEDGEKPRDVALTLWLVVKDEKGNVVEPPELRIFRANSIVIKQLTEMRSEDEPIKGIQFRVTRMDDRGNYMLQAKPKKLSSKEVKEAQKDKDAPDFDAMVTGQLRRAMEGIATSRALDDDDDDDEDEKPQGKKGGKGAKSGKGKKQADEEPDDENKNDNDEWPDDGLDEETVTVAKVPKDGQYLEIEHDTYSGKMKLWTTDDIEADLTDFSKGDEITVSATGPDDDGDYILSEEPEAAEEGSGGEDPDEDEKGDELPDEIEDEEFVVKEIDTGESTMEVESEELELEFTLYFLDKGPASEVDFDDYEEGTKIKVSAEKDSMGDMVATEIPEVITDKKKSGGKKSGGKKSGGKSSGKKKGGKGKQ